MLYRLFLSGLTIVNQPSLERALEHAQHHCSARGSRLTEKRRTVLAGLMLADRALSAYELIDHCRDTLDVELFPMSVYRILDFLEGENLVHRLSLANKYVACSHIACDHEHEVPQFLICKACHRVREIGLPRQSVAAIERTVEATGYQLASRQIELDCLCAPCAASMQEAP